MRRCFKLIILAIMCVLFRVDCGTCVAAQDPYEQDKFLVSPFVVYAEDVLLSLESTMSDMVAARMRDIVSVVESPLIIDDLDCVDYLLTGSIMVVNGKITTRAELIDIKNGEISFNFNFSGLDTNGGVLSHVDELCCNLNIFFLNELCHRLVDEISTVFVSTQVEGNGLFQLSDPVVLFRKEVDSPVVSVATGDVDGDLVPELVAAFEREVVIYKINETGLQLMTRFKTSRNCKILSVDVADINDNGLCELFVTQFGPQDKLNSVVLEFINFELQVLSSELEWYFRVIKNHAKADYLVGQKRSIVDLYGLDYFETQRHFAPGIYLMEYSGGYYLPKHKLDIPASVCIYNFTIGPLVDFGEMCSVVYSDEDTLEIFMGNEDVSRTSDEIFGGSRVYFPQTSSDSKQCRAREYMTQRLLVIDIGGDDRCELVTAKNHDCTERFLSRFRKFDNGYILVFRWNGIQFSKICTLSEETGYISDFAINDVSEDGLFNLFYAVSKRGKLFAKQINTIVFAKFEYQE